MLIADNVFFFVINLVWEYWYRKYKGQEESYKNIALELYLVYLNIFWLKQIWLVFSLVFGPSFSKDITNWNNGVKTTSVLDAVRIIPVKLIWNLQSFLVLFTVHVFPGTLQETNMQGSLLAFYYIIPHYSHWVKTNSSFSFWRSR